jgi:LysR family transcriptional activator of nhaA
MNLNYHHLRYFWTVVQEGSVSAASKRLRVAQPTVSEQLKTLEEAVGAPLFARKGRTLELTEVGLVVRRYADEIFALGQELQDALEGRPTGRPQRLSVGISDGLPKLVPYRILEPALRMNEAVHLVCFEDKPDRLLADLSLHAYDLVLTDAPANSLSTARVYSHLLGESTVSLFAEPSQAARLRRRFPASLDGAPLLVPPEGTTMRRSLSHWFDQQGLRPRIVGEFQDSALLEIFGQAGAGVFPGLSALEEDIRRKYQVELVGTIASIRERFYAISVERRLRHPGVLVITQVARQELFGRGEA